MKLPEPFADDSSSASVAELTIENGTDKIALYGNLDITRDKAGLVLARELTAYLGRIVSTLQADVNLPDKISPNRATKTVRNPFS